MYFENLFLFHFCFIFLLFLQLHPYFLEFLFHLKLFLIFCRSEELKIFLEIPPPLGVLGIKTKYFPAKEIKVVKAAPF